MGKVRNSHTLVDHPDKIFVHASNRVSAFDFVLPARIDRKGEILTATNHFWVTQVLSPFIDTDLIACGAGIDEFLPEAFRGRPEWQKTGTVVKRYSSPEEEDIFRFNLTGSGFNDYKETGMVCGHRLPPRLINGSRLPTPLYTPSSKAKEGHDVNLDVYDVIAKHGPKRGHLVLMIAGMMAQYAMERGIIIADGKLEIIGNTLIDEKGTPDSCRFWDLKDWLEAHAKGKLPPALDKQFVRNECLRLGIEKMDPKKPGDVALVDEMTLSNDVCRMTTLIYRYIFWRLTGKQIEVYQHSKMGIISAVAPMRKIAILIGSESDQSQTQNGLASLLAVADVSLRVLSCHRNFDELPGIVKDELAKADIVIAGAGQAAALPGMVKSALCAINRPDISVIGVAFERKTEKHDLAAKLSIECLPGQPVELDADGNAYFGSEGFLQACQAAVTHEFLPKTIESKPSKVILEAFS